MSGFVKFMAGVAVGAVAAALLTPESGEDLRYRIKTILRKKGLIAKEQVDELVEVIAGEIENK